MLTQERLKELLYYNPQFGIFVWKNKGSWNKKGVRAERPAGCGYLRIGIDGVRYPAHRLAWLYVRGEFPKDVIDHINRKPSDNRIVNLRSVSQQENTKNGSLSKNNTSGHNGVYWHRPRNKWCAYIKVDYKKKHLGLYADIDDAIMARKEAEKEYGFHENHGK